MVSIHSREYRVFRAAMKRIWQTQDAPCAADGQRINYDGPRNDPDSFEMDHIMSRRKAKMMGRLDLIMDPRNVQPMHVRCNRAKGAGESAPDIGETSEEW